MSIPYEEAVRNITAMNNLRICLRLAQNGSNTTVSIAQDDATRVFTVRVGNQLYWGDSLFDALQNAADEL